MYRRDLLKVAIGVPLVSARLDAATAAVPADPPPAPMTFARVRPGDAGWPSDEAWTSFGNAVGNQLMKLDDPLAACREEADSPACQALLKELRDPYFISDDPGLTEASGWLDAWTSRPSTYAVKVRTSEDVAAAVNFAREHNLRLVATNGARTVFRGSRVASDQMESLRDAI